ncbi:hypothetical protein BBD42_15410 [Paenibacillus sp. BIHB 4019]|uniref:Uncharacterized protein n=1 Tax=Paenibacillus sp. BIHB 4019 TaxID=1870819 RepID=A0A1B2DJ29_9BACL|nr:hypothetical protein [Paenibacillus sp. BIHB 4019]ANY67699.1 hypothetical protein BBD42_15410 [Paenibacillus sp. BIHB 4019]
MAKINVVIPATNVEYEGVTYEQVNRKAQAGDIVRHDAIGYSFLPKGAFYGVFIDEGGDAAIRDEDGDLSGINGDFTVFAPIKTAESAPKTDEITYEGATYRKVYRSARKGDVIVFEEAPSFTLTSGKTYPVTRLDYDYDAQITNDNGGEYDTCGDSFEVYEKVTEPIVYTEVKRKAAEGERIRIVDTKDSRWKNGDEFVVARLDAAGSVFVDHQLGLDNKQATVWHREYVVLEPVTKAEPKSEPARPERLKVGEYAKVTEKDGSSFHNIGDIVKITEDDNSWIPFKLEHLDGKYAGWTEEGVLVRATDEEVAAARKYNVGDYVRVTKRGCGHNYDVGEIVKVTHKHFGSSFCGIKASTGAEGNTMLPEHVESATEADFNAIYDPRRQFAAGDKVRLVSGGDVYPLIGFGNGVVYEVKNALYPTHGGNRIEISGGKYDGYALPEQLVKLTEEEAAELEKAAEIKRKWDAIGRKVDEYKDGDIVRFTQSTGADGYPNDSIVIISDVEGEDFRFGGIGNRQFLGDTTWCVLITPVEQRFDR